MKNVVFPFFIYLS